MENNETQNWLKITELKDGYIRYWNMNQIIWVTFEKDNISFSTSTKVMENYLFNLYKIEFVSYAEMIKDKYNNLN